MSRNLYEMLEKMTSYKTPTDPSVVDSLRAQSKNHAFMEIIRMNFDPNFVGFDLPEGAPPYERDEKQPYGYADSNISANIRKLYIFFNDYTKITKKKKEFMFQGVLESLHFREADLLVAVKDKVLSDLFPDITEAAVREAFPTLLPPLGDDDLIDAAIVMERELEQGIIEWQKYTKEEIIRLAYNKRIVFKFPEHAERLGLTHLDDSYVAPEPVYSPEEYLIFTVEKSVFNQIKSTVFHFKLDELDIEEVIGKKKGARITFGDLDQAKALGLDYLDERIIAQKREEIASTKVGRGKYPRKSKTVDK